MRSVFKVRFTFRDGFYYKVPTVVYRTEAERRQARYDQEKFIETANRVFGEMAVVAPSEVHDDPSGFLIVQREMSGRILTIADVFDDRTTFQKLRRIYDTNLILWHSEGISLDFLGFDALFKPWRIYNVITDGSHLKLFDFGLFSRHYPRWGDRIQSILLVIVQSMFLAMIITLARLWHGLK